MARRELVASRQPFPREGRDRRHESGGSVPVLGPGWLLPCRAARVREPPVYERLGTMRSLVWHEALRIFAVIVGIALALLVWVKQGFDGAAGLFVVSALVGHSTYLTRRKPCGLRSVQDPRRRTHRLYRRRGVLGRSMRSNRDSVPTLRWRAALRYG